MSVAFSPGCTNPLETRAEECGTRLFTASVDGTLRFYLLRIDDLVALAHTRVARSLTTGECQQYLHLEQCPEAAAPLTQISATAAKPITVPGQPPASKEKVCQVTDESGVNDQFFNQDAYKDVREAAARFDWEGFVLESQQQGDFVKNISDFLQSGCDLIVTVGLRLGDATQAAAEANPDQKFIIMDLAYDPPLDNVWQQVYAIDQAAFLAGYLAASVTRAGKIGTFGGSKTLAVIDIMDSFALGVAYYNEKNGGRSKCWAGT